MIISNTLSQLLDDKKPLDLFKVKDTSRVNVEDISFYDRDMITYNGNSTFSIYSDYGLTDSETNMVTFPEMGEYGDMIVIPSGKLVVFSVGKVGVADITKNVEGKNKLGAFSVTNISTGNFYDISLKQFNSEIVYYKNYNTVTIYQLSTNSILTTYNASSLILDVKIVAKRNNNYEALMSMETRGKSQLYLIDLTRNLELANNIHLPLSQEYPEDPYLGYVNFIEEHDGYIYTTQYNGYISRAKITSTTNFTMGPFQVLFKGTGYTKKIHFEGKYVFTINGYDDLYIYSPEDGNNELVELKGNALEIIADPIVLTVLYKDGNTDYAKLNYYSLLDEFPSLQINNVKLERRPLYDGAGKLTGKYKYYNAINLMVINSIPNKISTINVNVGFSHPGFADQSIVFNETNNPKNVYLPIINKAGNDFIETNYVEGTAYPNSLSIKDYSSIFSTSPLTGVDYSFTISDLKNSIDFHDVTPKISTDFYNDLNLVNFKDFYYLNGYIYYRMRILSSDPNLIATVGTLSGTNPMHFNGSVYYNKVSNPTLEGRIRDKVIVDNVYDLRSIHTNSKYTSSKPTLGTYNVDIYSLDEETPISKQYNWFRMEYNGDIDALKELPIFYSIGRLSGTTYSPITYEANLANIKKSYQNQTVRIANQLDVKSVTFDGDIQLLETMYVSRADEGSKELYLDNMSNISFESRIPKASMRITDKDYVVNGETISGYLSLPLEYNSYQYKSNSMLGEIYINGKKAFNKFIRQNNSFNGILNIYYPTESLRPLLTAADYNLVMRDEIPNAKITGVLRKRRLVNSEDVLAFHTIKNLYQDEISLIQTNGIYFNIKISDYMSSDRFRVFIKGRKGDLFARINPDSYHITLDRQYGQLLLRIPSASYIQEGMTIMIVSNGITDRTIFYDKLSEQYDVDSVPLLQTTNNKYLMMTGKRADDIDININGFTLVPNIDFSIVDDIDSTGNPIALAVFRNLIPSKSVMEINFLDEGTYHTKFFPSPSVNDNKLFVLEDDHLFFRENMFEVFANNLRIPKEDVTVIDSKTIRINTTVTQLINVMIRFSFEPHHNLDDIFGDYKLNNFDQYRNDYHSMANKLNLNSNFDILCGHKKSTSISKLSLKSFLDKVMDGEYELIEDTQINANIDSGLLWDVNVDGEEIDSQYLKDNLFIRSNINWKIRRVSNNPDI